MLQSEFDSALTSLVQGDIRDKKFLLAVSGGIDSMSMATLFHNSPLKLTFGIANVNFTLRGEDSYLDQALVRKWAEMNQVDFYTIDFETAKYAKQNSISTQMAARELRYEWFYQLIDQYGYDYLSIAHNMDDSAETLFLNLLRGTGVKGLSGIKKTNGKIIRPMLTISRKRIVEYVEEHKVPYRDDFTNFESHYSRNRIRNVVFPEFKKINPSFLNTISRNTSYFSQAADVLDDLYKEKEGTLYRTEGDTFLLDINELMKEKRVDYWLFRILSEKGFNTAQVASIKSSLSGQSGKVFRSPDHELVIDRGFLKVYPLGEDSSDAYLSISEPGVYTFRGVSFKFDIFIRPEGFKPIPQDGQLFFNAQDIKFPIICRGWIAADKFRPFGMKKGFKKLSDFFIDLKMSKRDKERQPIFTEGENIICLPGLRIDDRYKITTSTNIIAEVVIENIVS